MLSWIFTLAGLAVSFAYIDLDSSSFIGALLCPIIFTAFLISAVIKFRNSSQSETYVGSSISSSSSSSSSMDSWTVSGDSFSGGDCSGGGD
ncbi:hypothetical protein [Litorilituus lipolyticus]|uniref:Uncharacterized protein n=1 Tax=Litorilituus lipolyticus TaxID=2491017 RepID=A0A502KWB1_9GAMM|nr:hypothetical protein [Litorilituus lipolyticus]TPH12487.1 hypothetical protein EPA86_16170 [Litorilituus lipolyticus]